MTEQFRQQPDNPKNIAPEAGAGPLGASPPEHSPQAGGSRSPERQQLPSVWDVLERKARLYTPVPPKMPSEEYDRERRELNRLEDEIDKRGTTREKLILELFTNIIIPSVPGGFTYAGLSPKKFQKVRSQVEPLSDEEIGEEVRKQKEENDRIRKLPRPPSVAHSNPSIPDDLIDKLSR